MPIGSTIVTGASRGTGAAVAALVDRPGSEFATEGGSVVAAIGAAGGHAKAVQGDVASADDVRWLLDQVGAAFEGIDALIGNAGVMAVPPLGDVGDAAFERHFAINVRGPFLGMREAASRLRDGGRIKHMAAMTPQGRIGQPAEIAEGAAYLASPEAARIIGQVARVNGGVA